MLLVIPRLVAKLLVGLFLFWVFTSTVVPQMLLKYSDPQIQNYKFIKHQYPYNSITSPNPLLIRKSDVYFVIGHPDDEVMFFSPSLIELAKAKHENRIKLICFSRGDAVDATMGDIRVAELKNSARILGVAEKDVIVVNGFKDGMDVTWEAEKVASTLDKLVANGTPLKPAVVITFDENGVLHHPNHISLYHGCKKLFATRRKAASLYVLKTLNFWEKYSFTLLTSVELFVDLVSKFILSVFKIHVNISFFNSSQPGLSVIKVYLDLNMLSVSYAAMAYGHFSQMVWFRYGWLVFTRYLTFNQLTQIA